MVQDISYLQSLLEVKKGLLNSAGIYLSEAVANKNNEAISFWKNKIASHRKEIEEILSQIKQARTEGKTKGGPTVGTQAGIKKPSFISALKGSRTDWEQYKGAKKEKRAEWKEKHWVATGAGGAALGGAKLLGKGALGVGKGLGWLFKPREPGTGSSAGKIFSAILLIVMVAVGGFGAFLYSQTPAGNMMWQGLKAQATGLKEMEKRISPSINVIQQLVQGTYQPGGWEAREVQSSYSVPEDAGVSINNLRPARSAFYSGEAISIKGDVTIVTPQLLLDSTSVRFSVNCPDCQGGTWECYISGEACTESLCTITQAYNKELICINNAPGIVLTELTTAEITLNWNVITSAVGTKQIYVTRREILEQFKNPAEHFGIERASMQPWQASDGTINFGIGFDEDIEFLSSAFGTQSSSGFIQAYSPNEKYKPAYYLGASIKNKGLGKVSEIDSLKLILPADSNIKIDEGVTRRDFENIEELRSISTSKKIETNNKLKDLTASESMIAANKNKEGNSNSITASAVAVSESQEGLTALPPQTYLQEYELTSASKSIKPIESGLYESFYVKLAIDEAFLGGASYNSFLVKGELNYTYAESEAVAVTIKPAPAERAESITTSSGECSGVSSSSFATSIESGRVPVRENVWPAGSWITPYVIGLSNCAGKTVTFWKDSTQLSSCVLTGSGCDGTAISLPAGTYTLYAKIDINNDGDYDDWNEQASKQITLE